MPQQPQSNSKRVRVRTKDRTIEMGRLVLAIAALAEQLGEEAAADNASDNDRPDHELP